MIELKSDKKGSVIDTMFAAGAHFGFAKARRHPSTKPYIFGIKNKVEIFDLEKTTPLLQEAKEFVRALAAEGKQILFVSGKAEGREAIKQAALGLEVPYVAGRWIGGTLTNFAQIRARVDKMLDMTSKKEKGELAKYTKKERLLMDREVSNLRYYFDGIVLLKDMPKALFVIDPKREHIAVTEAQKNNIPVIALCGSDCDITNIDYPIVANDGSVSSVRFFIKEIAAAYQDGKNMRAKAAPAAASVAPRMSTAPKM